MGPAEPPARTRGERVKLIPGPVASAGIGAQPAAGGEVAHCVLLKSPDAGGERWLARERSGWSRHGGRESLERQRARTFWRFSFSEERYEYIITNCRRQLACTNCQKQSILCLSKSST